MSEPSPKSTLTYAEMLTVTLQHSGPIELAELSVSLHALSSQHARFAHRTGATVNGDRTKLYVREIRSGSIIVEMVAFAQQFGSLASAGSSILTFAKNLRGVLHYGTGKTTAPPEGTTAADARDVSTFLKPVASDPRGVVSITAGDGSTNIVNLVVNSDDANAAQNRLNNYAARQAETTSGVHQNQLLYFNQLRGVAEAEVGDKGIIERFAPYAVKLLFANSADKAAVLADRVFSLVYDVDVEVQTVEGKPVRYRILTVHGSFERSENAP